MDADTEAGSKQSGEQEFRKLLDSTDTTEIVDDDELEEHKARMTRILLDKGVVLDGDDMDHLLSLKLYMQSVFVRRIRARGSAKAQKDEFERAMGNFTAIPDIQLQCEAFGD